MPRPAGPVACNVKVCVLPARRAEFLTVIKHDAAETLSAEPDALQFVLGEDVSSANTFHLHEQYTTRAALAFHHASPHFLAWKAFCATGPFEREREVAVFRCGHAPRRVPPRAALGLNVELCVRAEFREEFLRLAEVLVRGSEAEALCLQYDFGEALDVPGSFYFHEQYTGGDGGREGLEAHEVSEHFGKFLEFLKKNPLTKESVVSQFQCLASYLD